LVRPVGVQSEALHEVGVQSEALHEVGVQSEALHEVGVQSEALFGRAKLRFELHHYSYLKILISTRRFSAFSLEIGY
jgi:hypothetical protein